MERVYIIYTIAGKVSRVRKLRMVIFYGKAPGKVILFGEHFVVSGNPAIAAAIKRSSTAYTRSRRDEWISIESKNLNVRAIYKDGWMVTRGGRSRAKALTPLRALVEEARRRFKRRDGVDISISSEIPIAAGLGSSASTAVSTAASLLMRYGAPFDRKAIIGLASTAERVVHGKPSGIDHTVIALGGVIAYKPQEAFSPLSFPTFKLVVVNTRRFRSTGRLVAKVLEYLQSDPVRRGRILSEANEIVSKAVKTLSRGDLESLGKLMYRNHELLREVGASSPELDLIVKEAKDHGALGAKLTGAGGGGCAIILPREGSEGKVCSHMESLGFEAFIAEIDEKGVVAGILDEGEGLSAL